MNYRDQYLEYKKKYLELKKNFKGGLINQQKTPNKYILEDEYKKIINLTKDSEKEIFLKDTLYDTLQKYERCIEKAQKRKQKIREKNKTINKLIAEKELLNKKLDKMKEVYIIREKLENFDYTNIE